MSQMKFMSRRQTNQSLITYILNLIDLAFTIYAIYNGATEVNPLMQCIPVQIFYKVFVIGIAILWLTRRPEAVAKHGLRAMTVVYSAVIAWHIVNLVYIRLNIF